MDCRTCVDAEGFLRQRQPLEVLIQLIQPRIGKDRQRTKHHYGRDCDGNLAGVRLQHRLGGHYGCGSADAATGTDQHGGLAIEAEHFFTQPAGQQESAAQGQGIDNDPAGPHVGNLLEG